MNKKLAVPPRQNVVQIKDFSKKAFPVHVLSWSSSVGQDHASFDEPTANPIFTDYSAGMSGALGAVFQQILISSSRIGFLLFLAQGFHYKCICRCVDELAVIVLMF